MSRGGMRRTQRKAMVRARTYANSRNPAVSVIIPVVNERKTIGAVIRQAFRVHPRTEVIVIANGSTDGSAAIACKMGAEVISFDWPLGHDVGRAVGASRARGSVLLFVDGDILIPARDLLPLVRAVTQDGVDVALNKYTGPVNKMNVHNVVLAKHALNYVLSRFDLRGASLTTIPHAMSRQAAETIGLGNLAIPPKAQAMAVHRGLKVSAVHLIDVGRRNRVRRRPGIGHDPVGEMIVGDHLEAIHWFMEQTDPRGGKTDMSRIREFAR